MEWINELVLLGDGDAAPNRAQGSAFFVGNAIVILNYAGLTPARRTQSFPSV